MKWDIGFYRKVRMKIRTIDRIYDELKLLRFEQRKYLLEQNILNSDVPGISDERYCDHEIVVSLTTHGKRIYEVHLAIESIMEQTVKANRMILWLDDGFRGRRLPRTLQLQRKRGLEIGFCKDIRSYKKLIPSLEAFPDAAVITVDDDLIYETTLLENLITAYQQDSSYIYCCRHHRMLRGENKKLLPYNLWQKEEPTVDYADIMNFPTGCGGILYPPRSLDESVFDESVFMDICPYADDIWFKAMAVKKGTLSKKVHTHDSSGNEFIENKSVQDIGLKRVNTENDCLNDKQIAAVFDKYDLYKVLR